MSKEDDVWHLLGAESNWVAELNLSISSKLVVLTGGTLELRTYLL